MTWDFAFNSKGVLCPVEYIECKKCGNTVGVIYDGDNVRNVVKNNPPECDVCNSKEWKYIGIIDDDDKEDEE